MITTEIQNEAFQRLVTEMSETLHVKAETVFDIKVTNCFSFQQSNKNGEMTALSG